jgi:hypothetical protein
LGALTFRIIRIIRIIPPSKMKVINIHNSLVVVVFAALSHVSTVVTAQTKTDHVVTIPLLGDMQVPPVDSTATGAITFVYSEATESIYWAMDIFNNETTLGIFGASGAHIHCGGVGENGDVLISLVEGGIMMSDMSEEIGLAGEITAESIVPGLCYETILEVWAAMSTGFNLYVNVHSEENPSGEIRGDFAAAVPPPTTSSVVAVSLSGDAQVPPVEESTVSGMATFVYSEATKSIGWVMDIANPEGLFVYGAPGAHIHCGGPGTNGGVVVPLVGPDMADNSTDIGAVGLITVKNFVPGLCYDNIPDLWLAMTQGSVLYVNVHSEENPSGEIRGDIIGAGSVPTTPTMEPTASPGGTTSGSPTAAPGGTPPGSTEAPTTVSSAATTSTSSMSNIMYILVGMLFAGVWNIML